MIAIVAHSFGIMFFFRMTTSVDFLASKDLFKCSTSSLQQFLESLNHWIVDLRYFFVQNHSSVVVLALITSFIKSC
jgi:hypothetical protein